MIWLGKKVLSFSNGKNSPKIVLTLRSYFVYCDAYGGHMKINAAKLKHWRQVRDVPIRILAGVADLTPRRIQQIEKHGGDINRNIAAAIAKKLKIKLGDLV